MTDLISLPPVEAEIVAGLDPTFQSFALSHRSLVLSEGIPFVFVSGRRSRTEQQHLVDTLPPGQAAAVGTSFHELGFAYDGAGPRNDAEWLRYGLLAESLGLEWGGRFRNPERWHVEVPFSRVEVARFQRMRVVAGILAVGGVAAIIIASGGSD